MTLPVLGIALAVSAAPLPVSYSNPNTDDLSFFRARLEGKTMVEIGEATHGASEFYLFKTKMVLYLHEKLGYNILALECGMLETGLALHHRNRPAKELMKACLFANYQWLEMVRLFDYLKTRPQLRVIGIDPQFSSDEVLTSTRDLLRPYDEELALDAEKHLGDGYGYLGKTADPVEFRRLRDAYLKWLDAFAAKMKKIKAKPADAARFQLLERSLRGLRQYWDYEPNAPLVDRLAARDRLMADNLLAQIGKDKAIVWAHNGHIGKGLGYPILGDHLRRALGTRTYALGLFAQKGDCYQHWTKTSQAWGAASGGLESLLPNTGEGWFQDAPEFKQPVKAYEPENGGLITFVPADRFDGLVVLTKISPPHKPTPDN